MVKALVSDPVTISEPAAMSVEATLEVPLSVSAPAPSLVIKPVPVIGPANAPSFGWAKISAPLSSMDPARLAAPPCRVAPLSIVNALVTDPVTSSEPAATSVEPTVEVAAQRQRAGVRFHQRAAPIDGAGEGGVGRLIEDQAPVVGDRPPRQQVGDRALQRAARIDP